MYQFYHCFLVFELSYRYLFCLFMVFAHIVVFLPFLCIWFFRIFSTFFYLTLNTTQIPTYLTGVMPCIFRRSVSSSLTLIIERTPEFWTFLANKIWKIKFKYRFLTGTLKIEILFETKNDSILEHIESKFPSDKNEIIQLLSWHRHPLHPCDYASEILHSWLQS